MMIANTTQPNGEKKYCLSSFLNNMCKMRMMESAKHVVGGFEALSKCKEYKQQEISKNFTFPEIS